MSQARAAASRRDIWVRGLFMLGRMVLTVSALCVTYFLIPTRRPGDGLGVPWLILQLCVFAAVVGVQVPAIVRARYPILRAIESLAVLVPVYLLIFARVYLANSQNDPTGFSRPLDHVTALYFTVTVFATVGVGDIAPRSAVTRAVTTAQMLADLLVLGLVLRLVLRATREGLERKAATFDPVGRS